MGILNERACVTPTISIAGTVRTDFACPEATDMRGIVPGKALLKYLGDADKDTAGPIALTQPAVPLQHGMRVMVYDGTYRYHHGFLMVRRDQGAQDAVVWESHDDRILLQGCPVHGAIVRDIDQTAKFLGRYEARTNPNGMWNCMYVSASITGGEAELVPVFAPHAERSHDYESPTGTSPADPTADDGLLYPWTVRRFLKYLWVIANVNPNAGGVTGIYGTRWRNLYGAGSPKLTWDAARIAAITGLATPGGTDPLDRKMPDINFQGLTLLSAINRCLGAAGTHEIVIVPQADGTSKLDFAPTGYPEASGIGVAQELRLQRAGAAEDSDTIFDYNCVEDASETFDSVLVEGDVVRVETRAEYDPDAESTSKLAKAWTDDEEDAFLKCVNGGTSTDGSDTYAKIPTILGDEAFSASWADADGDGGRPLAYARTPEAIALARQSFPRVFRAFRLMTANLGTALSGQGSEYSSTPTWARLIAQRPVLADQLQYYLRDLSASGTETGNILSVRMPVRVEIYRREDEKWLEIPREVQLRVTGDGVVWLDGLAEAENGKDYCLYSGDLEDYTKVLDVEMRKFRLNVGMPMDHRVQGYAAVGTSVLHADYTGAIDGSPLLYIDSPQSYHEHHQVGSYPAAAAKYYAGGTGTAAPLTRMLPPGGEAGAAGYAATRRLASAQRIKKTSSWSMVGIRGEYRAGMWIEKIFLDDGVTPVFYSVDGSVEKVTWDFCQGQATSIGGVAREI